MKKNIGLLAVCLCAGAQAFNVGPYRLGMTNAEALEVAPLRSCSIGRSGLYECEGSFKVAGVERDVKLAFSPKTKRLEEISMLLEQPLPDSAWAHSGILPLLQMAPCIPRQWHPDYEDFCAVQPRTVRTVYRSKQWKLRGKIWVSASSNSDLPKKHAQVLAAEERANRRMGKLQEFQSGR